MSNPSRRRRTRSLRTVIAILRAFARGRHISLVLKAGLHARLKDLGQMTERIARYLQTMGRLLFHRLQPLLTNRVAASYAETLVGGTTIRVLVLLILREARKSTPYQYLIIASGNP